jgi:hypothetical protein
MKQRDPVIRDQLVKLIEECAVVRRSNMLEHTDREDAIETALNGAIVAELERNPIFESYLSNALTSDAQLFGRQCNTENLHSCGLSYLNGEAAPAAADIEHALTRLQEQLGDNVLFLLPLRLFQRKARPLKVGAGILKIGIEETPVEFERQIVMMRYIFACDSNRIVLLQAS